MAQHCYVAIQTSANLYKAIYIHKDGTAEHVLEILKSKYKTKDKVNELIALGDLSSIGNTIATCVAYHRDMGEDWSTVDPESYNAKALGKFESNVFAFTLENKWIQFK